MEPLRNKVSRGLFWGQLGRLLEVVLQLGFTVLIIRKLPVEQYGQYGLLMALVTLALLASSLGLGESLRRFLPEYAASETPGRARYFLDRMLLIRAGVLGGVLLCLAAGGAWILAWIGLPYSRTMLLCLLLLAGVAALEELLAGALTALLDLRQLYRVRIWVRVFNLSAALVLWRRGTLELQSVLMVLIVSQLAGVVVLWLLRHRTWRRAAAIAVPVAPAVSFGLAAWGSHVLTYILEARSDVLLLGLLLSDPQQVAFYNAGMVALLTPLSLFMTAPNTLALPAFSEARARGGAESLAKAAESFWKLILVCGIPICIFGAVFAERIIVAAFGGKYADAADVMRLVALQGILSLLLGQGVVPGLLYALDRQKQDVVIRVGGAAVNLGLAFTFIPRWGAVGAVAATATAGCMIFLCETWLARRVLAYRFPWLVAAKVIAVSGAVCAALYFLPLAGLVQITLAAGGFAAAFLLLLSFVKVLDARDRAMLGTLNNPFVQFIVARY